MVWRRFEWSTVRVDVTSARTSHRGLHRLSSRRFAISRGLPGHRAAASPWAARAPGRTRGRACTWASFGSTRRGTRRGTTTGTTPGRWWAARRRGPTRVADTTSTSWKPWLSLPASYCEIRYHDEVLAGAGRLCKGGVGRNKWRQTIEDRVHTHLLIGGGAATRRRSAEGGARLPKVRNASRAETGFANRGIVSVDIFRLVLNRKWISCKVSGNCMVGKVTNWQRWRFFFSVSRNWKFLKMAVNYAMQNYHKKLLNYAKMQHPLTHCRPAMRFGNRKFYFWGSFQFLVVTI